MLPYTPYPEPSANAIYNLLFCDALEDFANLAPHFPPIFASEFDEAAVRAIADDANAESRLRLLAFERLRRGGASVPKGGLLGVIAEVPLDGGLDTLAAYADGRVRYINQTGKMSIIEDINSPVRGKALAVMEAAQPLVDKIGPWGTTRPAPPEAPNVRLSFLCSDGLYFGQGSMSDLSGDQLAAPIMAAAIELLVATVDLSK